MSHPKHFRLLCPLDSSTIGPTDDVLTVLRRYARAFVDFVGKVFGEDESGIALKDEVNCRHPVERLILRSIAPRNRRREPKRGA